MKTKIKLKNLKSCNNSKMFGGARTRRLTLRISQAACKARCLTYCFPRYIWVAGYNGSSGWHLAAEIPKPRFLLCGKFKQLSSSWLAVFSHLFSSLWCQQCLELTMALSKNLCVCCSCAVCCCSLKLWHQARFKSRNLWWPKFFVCVVLKFYAYEWLQVSLWLLTCPWESQTRNTWHKRRGMYM